MNNNVQLYYFSPTGGTKACGEMFCKGISNDIKMVDLTARETVPAVESELAVFAVPVYGGRIPAVAAERIGAVNGAGRKAVTIVVYGTRAYEDALLEVNNVVSAAGFQVVASAAVVARHSIVPAVGQGRPDSEDSSSIAEFAAKVLAKLAAGDESPVTVPGNFPYKDGMNLPAAPVCLPECGKCGNCETVCPVAAISIDADGVKTDVDSCILCLACVAACPQSARILPPPLQASMNEKLAALIPVRRENEYFI